MKEHLRYSTRCRNTLGGRSIYTVPAPGFGSQADRQKIDADGGLAPAATGEGPQPEQDIFREVDHTHEAFKEDCLNVLFGEDTAPGLVQGFR